MNYRERISANPNVSLDKPVIKGTRITVELWQNSKKVF